MATGIEKMPARSLEEELRSRVAHATYAYHGREAGFPRVLKAMSQPEIPRSHSAPGSYWPL